MLKKNKNSTFPTASASLTGEHMEEDEKESDEIEINVGGDRGLGREKEEKERQNRVRHNRYLLHLLDYLFVFVFFYCLT